METVHFIKTVICLSGSVPEFLRQVLRVLIDEAVASWMGSMNYWLYLKRISVVVTFHIFPPPQSMCALDPEEYTGEGNSQGIILHRSILMLWTFLRRCLTVYMALASNEYVSKNSESKRERRWRTGIQYNTNPRIKCSVWLVKWSKRMERNLMLKDEEIL